MVEPTVVAIDGPASSGKNTIGYSLATKLNFLFINTGDLYRAGCHFLIANGFPLDDLSILKRVFRGLSIDIRDGEEGQQIFVEQENITQEINSPDINNIVSVVGSISEVREAIRARQLAYGMSGRIVMAGRNIGSEIFPNATNKFFITAPLADRAKRRFEQMKTTHSNISYQEVFDNIARRDSIDLKRDISPMKIAEDAIVIDTVNKSVDEIVLYMYEKVFSRSRREQFENPSIKERL